MNKLSNRASKTLFTLLILSVGLVSSCSDLLDENPKTIAVETFYNTVGEVETAVNAIYQPLRSSNTNGVGVYIAVLDATVDYGYGRGSYTIHNDFQGLDNVNESRVSGMWEEFYLSIRNANIVLKNVPNGNAISQEDKDRYMAEACFLRAFAYYHLVQCWGAIPLRTENNLDEVACKRSSVSDVFDLIVKDLIHAETYLPEAVSIIGHPTKWSAKTLLSDVYLYLKKYKDAQDKADEVIKSARYELVEVSSSDDFQKIFGPNVITTKEEIFYLKFTQNASQGNLFPWLINHPSTKLHGGGGVFGLIGYNNDLFYTSWDDNDLRKGMWYYCNVGMGNYTMLNNKFIDPKAIGGTGAGNDQPWYRYSDVLLIYAEASNAASGPTKEAMDALNQVHRRAYGKNPKLSSDVDFLLEDYTQASFFDLIIKERGYEFQYEGKRWLELKRTEKAKEIIKKYKGKEIADRAYLWPIPIKEFNYNKALDPIKDQNPGYN